MEHEHKCRCGHHHEEKEHDDGMLKEMVYDNCQRVDALISVLIRNGVITESQLHNMQESLVGAEEPDDEDDD